MSSTMTSQPSGGIVLENDHPLIPLNIQVNSVIVYLA
jgi:hypothetical protein